MQDKLERLFKEINVEDNLLSYFNNASVEKVIIYDRNKLLDFIINTENYFISSFCYDKCFYVLILLLK